MQTMWDNGTNWGYWRLEPNEDGKLTKKPKNPYTGNNADPSDLSTWGTSWDAQARNLLNPVDDPTKGGMAFVLVDNMAGIDIDAHGVDKNPLQDEIMALFDGTYMEKSPSGKGIHILFRVDKSRLPILENGKWDGAHYYQKNTNIDVESYVAGCTNRYLTFTSTMVSESMDMLDMTDQFLTFIEKYQKKSLYKKQAPVATTQTIQAVDMDVDEILDIARDSKSGAAFCKLYDNGDWQGDYQSQSEADLGLCDRLAYWLGKDPVKMDTAFRASALMRPKWDVVHDGSQTYGEMTIAAAIRDTQNVFTGEKRVNTRKSAENGSESLSEPQQGDIFDMKVLRYELAQRNIKMRFNNMTQELVIDGLPDYVDPDKSIEYIITEIYGDMRRKYKYASLSTIGTLVNALATDMRIQYHPVLEYFKGKKWDGKPHLERLYETLGIQDDELSKILVRKWFMQGWALLYNDPKNPYGADGVLTLAGGQGIGKTSFFKVMSINDADWFREGQAISEDKDTRMSALSAWICELGEIGCTFKSDMDSLKAFITDSKDRYRRHYAATPTKALRRTNLGGTVNGTEFLIDQTGNRRFWTVPLGDKNIAPLLYDKDYTNPTQIWLQVWEQYCQGKSLRECFRLTDEEQKMLAERNNKCEKPIEGEEQIKAIFDEAVSFDWMTLRDWMNRHDLRGQIREKYVRQILDKFGATVQDKKIDGKSKTVRWLPR